MGMKILFLAGRRVGDIPVSSSTTAYVAGQPLQLDSNGELTLNTNGYIYGGGATYNHVGLALGHSGSTSDRYSDLYNGKAGVLVGAGNIVELNNSDPENPDDDFPFDTSMTYSPGDDLYIDTNGKLTNAAPGTYDVPSNSDPIAYVIQPPSSAVLSMSHDEAQRDQRAQQRMGIIPSSDTKNVNYRRMVICTVR